MNAAMGNDVWKASGGHGYKKEFQSIMALEPQGRLAGNHTLFNILSRKQTLPPQIYLPMLSNHLL